MERGTCIFSLIFYRHFRKIRENLCGKCFFRIKVLKKEYILLTSCNTFCYEFQQRKESRFVAIKALFMAFSFRWLRSLQMDLTLTVANTTQRWLCKGTFQIIRKALEIPTIVKIPQLKCISLVNLIKSKTSSGRGVG